MELSWLDIRLEARVLMAGIRDLLVARGRAPAFCFTGITGLPLLEGLDRGSETLRSGSGSGSGSRITGRGASGAGATSSSR